MSRRGAYLNMRITQQWAVLAPELRERHCMDDESNKSFGLKHIFSDRVNFDLIGALGRPVLPAVFPKSVPLKEHDEEDYPWPKSLGIFDILSCELVDMIIDHVSDSDSGLISLALTSLGFWNLIIHRIQSEYVKGAAPWAGKKLALQGDFSTTLPPSFEENSLAMSIVSESKVDFTPHVAKNLFYALQMEGRPPKTPKSYETSLLKAFEEYFLQSKIPKWRWEEMREQIICPDFWPEDQEWVLRNLTRKEYVSPWFYVGVIKATKIRLVDALLAKIAWSDSPSWDDRWGSLDLRGEWGSWAGDRFDVVAKERFVDELGFDGWKDVTDDVVRGVKRLR